MLHLSADGKTVAGVDASGRQVLLWDVAKGELVQQVPLNITEETLEPPAGLAAPAGLVLKRAFAGPLLLSPDGKHLVFANAKDDAILVIAPGAKEPVWRLKGHEARVQALAMAPDGKALLSGGDDQSVPPLGPGARQACRRIRNAPRRRAGAGLFRRR